MKYRRRIYHSAEQCADIWDRWQRGELVRSIGRVFDRQSSSVFSVISPTGGIRPPNRMRGKFALCLSEREEISRGLSMKQSLRVIARRLGRAPSTISRDIRRNGGRAGYRATTSDLAAWDCALRPKSCKLACHPSLTQAVSAKLRTMARAALIRHLSFVISIEGQEASLTLNTTLGIPTPSRDLFNRALKV